MIIGVSGKKQSGKDLVGTIIQYLLTIKIHSEEEFVQLIKNDINRINHSSWEIHKFADALKYMICILINCTRDQLEDEDFKNTELGEDWTIWKLIPDNDHNLFEGNCQLNEGIFSTKQEVEKYIKKHEIINVLNIESEILTPRKLLQLLGTEAGRNIIHPNLWIISLFSKYKNNPIQRPIGQDTYYVNNFPNWIITDVRFLNEVESVKAKGGINIRVNRNKNLYSYCDGIFTLSELYKVVYKDTGEYPLKSYVDKNWLIKPNEHVSETDLDDYDKFDYIIDNDGTIEELIEKVKIILINEKIL